MKMDEQGPASRVLRLMIGDPVDPKFPGVLYRAEEIPHSKLPERAIVVEGIVRTFVFHPGRAGRKSSSLFVRWSLILFSKVPVTVIRRSRFVTTAWATSGVLSKRSRSCVVSRLGSSSPGGACLASFGNRFRRACRTCGLSGRTP